VIRHYTEDRRRHNYANTVMSEKPQPGVITRIRQNITAIHKDRKEDAAEIQQRLKLIPDRNVNRHTRIEAPGVTTRMEPSTLSRRQRPPEQTDRPARPAHSRDQERGIGSGQVTAPGTVQRQRPPEQAGRPAPPIPFQEQKRVIGSGQVTAPTTIQRSGSFEQVVQAAPPAPSQQQERDTQPQQISPSAPAGRDKDRNSRIK
jgi:hypothetical protein